MGTALSDVADLFMTKVSDYRLDTIFSTSGSQGLNNYVEPWLLSAILEFDICTPPLVYVPTSGSIEGEFGDDLTLENKMILAELMVKFWLQKSIQDILQMNNNISDHDFKMFSQAQNLQSKKDYFNMVRESCSQMLINYEYKYNDWAGWKAQF